MTFARLRPHFVALLAVGLPLVGANIARLLIAISDTVVVGRYGVEALAALVLATSYQLVLLMLGAGYAMALLGILASAIARDDDAEVRRTTRMAIWLAMLHSVVVMPLMWWSEPILLAFGQDPVVSELAQEFLRIYGFATAPLLWAMTLNTYLATLGRASVVLWITLAGLPVNVALSIIFVFGFFGIPELGVTGAALAGLIVNTLLAVALMAYSLWLPKARRYQLGRNPWRPEWPVFVRLFRLGLPVGMTSVAELGLFAGSNLIMGLFGPQALAAHGIAIQLEAIAFMVYLGIGSAATIRVGEAVGRSDPQMIADTGKATMILSAVIASLTAAIFILAPEPLAGLYLDPRQATTPAIVALSGQLLIWAGVLQLADGQQAMALGLLRGVLDTRAPMVMASVAYWVVGLPSAYLVAITLGYGPQGVWLGMMAGLTVAAVLLMTRFWRGRRHGDWTRAIAAS